MSVEYKKNTDMSIAEILQSVKEVITSHELDINTPDEDVLELINVIENKNSSQHSTQHIQQTSNYPNCFTNSSDNSISRAENIYPIPNWSRNPGNTRLEIEEKSIKHSSSSGFCMTNSHIERTMQMVQKSHSNIHQFDDINMQVKKNLGQDLEDKCLQILQETLTSNRSAIEATNVLQNFSKMANEKDTSISKEKILEELVVKMLQPQLSKWLDKNLPFLVKQLVEKEVQRLVANKGLG